MTTDKFVESNEKRVVIDKSKRFSNGTYIFDSNGRQLDPRTTEGGIIESIYARQAQTRKENAEQRKKFEKITGRDIDGDGKIG